MYLKQALRRSLRSPGFALAVALLVAAVVAVNATAFSAMWALNYKALPYREGDRLVELRADLTNFGFALGLLPSLYRDVLSATDVFEGAVGYSATLPARTDESGRDWRVRRITTDFAQQLGVAPALGRSFSTDDAQGRASVLVLSDETWRKHFGADPGVLGRELRLAGEPYTVVGVMPGGFLFPDSRVDAWMPYVATPAELEQDEGGNVGVFEVAARLAPGATVAQARERLAALMESATNLEGLRQAAGLKADVRTWRDRFAAEHWRAITLMQLAALILFAVVAANLANLTLDRMLNRQRDLSVCRALGARNMDIARAVLGDVLPPALAGVVAGVLLTPLGLSLLRSRELLPANLPISVGSDVPMYVVAAIAFALMLIVALLASLSIRSDASLVTRLGQRSRAAGLGRMRASMLVVQVALTTMLLGGSLLLVRSAINLMNEPRGFDERGVLMTAVDPLGVTRGVPFDPEHDQERLKAELLDVRDSLLALPGVEHVAFASVVPFSSWESVSTIRVAGVEDELQARDRSIGPNYFATLGIPLVVGREFIDADAGEASPVIVDELFVERWFAGRDPLASTVEIPLGEGKYRSATIVGVARTVKHEALDETPALPTVYQLDQVPVPVTLIVTRASGDPAALANSVRDRIMARLPNATVVSNRPLAEAIAGTLTGRRAMVEAIGAFAFATLLLAAVGLYAVLSFAVRRRTGELGVRMALGATSSRVLRLVMSQGGVLIVIGLVVGLAVGVPLARLLADRMHKVATWDPSIWAFAAFVIALVALFACWLPARRATKVTPTVALRAE